jgi:hypothetical protein
MSEATPTRELWETYQAFFDYFNDALFERKLPSCILSFHARGKSKGVFRASGWYKGEDIKSHEISLNPDLLHRQDTLIFETLVRQMVHLWQHEYGYPPAVYGYCNQNWADKMESLGLIPSDTGKPDGQKTGWHVAHYVDPAGRYQKALNVLSGESFAWKAEAYPTLPPKPKRVKFICPVCSYSVYGTVKGKLICNTMDCNAPMEEVTP